MSFLRALIVGSVLLTCIWRALRRYLLARDTAFLDAELAGTSRHNNDKIKGNVVICGGSVAGLLAARVCHNHFERVIIIEAETWLDTEDARKVLSWTQENRRSRIVQYTSTQGNQSMLYRGLCYMFPKFSEECHKSGIGIDAAEYSTHFFGHRLNVPQDKLPIAFFASRRALETLLRRLILDPKEYPNISQIIGTVSIRTANGTFTMIDAEVVIDCTGTTQAGLKWIERAGFTAKSDIPREAFDPKMHYATYRLDVSRELGALLPIPGGFDSPGGGILTVFPDISKDDRFVTSVKTEGRSLFICCGRWGSGADLPKTFQEIKPFVLSLPTEKPYPQWFFDTLDLLGDAEKAVSPISVAVGPSYWNHFERTVGLPSNWLAFGDSVSRINPLYGQGCTKALVGVLAMNTILQQSSESAILPANFAQRVFQAQAYKIGAVWESTKALDYAQKTTIPVEGETLDIGAFSRWYTRHLQILTETDADAATKLCRSSNMLDVVSIDMMHPLMLMKVIWTAMNRLDKK